MFGELNDIENLDPDQIQDIPTQGHGRMGGPIEDAIKGAANQETSQEAIKGAVGFASGAAQVIGHQAQKGADARIAMRQAELTKLRQKGLMSEQEFQRKAAMIMQGGQLSFWDKHRGVIVLGGLVVVGGVLLYFLKRKWR